MKTLRRTLLPLLLLLFVPLLTKAKEEPVELPAAWGTLRGTLWLPDTPPKRPSC